MIIVRVEKIAEKNAPIIMIHFLKTLSAKYPKISIARPEIIVKTAVNTPKGNVSPPKLKYMEMVTKFGGIKLESDELRATIAIKSMSDSFGRVLLVIKYGTFQN